jgi:Na+/melibiose symporter-like transporter
VDPPEQGDSLLQLIKRLRVQHNGDNMQLSTIIVKIVGLLLLVWTIRSIVKHLKERKTSGQSEQSITEQLLNNVLLYLWLAFMTVFSVGMMVNN